MAIFERFGAGLALLLLFGAISASDNVRLPSTAVCPVATVKDSILATRKDECPVDWIGNLQANGVIEGDEASLQRALNMVYGNKHDYVALLFYASWCPFSASFTPSFSILASLFPSVPHFAIEESAVKPSTLSKYGVHGFPTVFLLNSTIRVRYHGSRSLDSLVTFYNDVTGIETAPTSGISLDKMGCLSDQWKSNSSDPESCPFPWARSPENLLGQETYLALATAFVLVRLLYLFFPSLRRYGQLAWRRYITNMRLRNLWEHPLIYLNRAKQVFNSLKEPCKRSNLQEGAMNAKAWASKSLASVSFGDGSSSRVVPIS
ncbi:OLC1v1017396C1 [Oldenlandia corymbosa var. corymbosa]|uniref:OLC1v1017396C1 n=1 Tax=Oldenlandia corymbosa var. corymbosa TaxID=529605 RepID=A0AAV1E9I6_OLDCO|nr:OLC1v1017396C1 [Oldenlandia corymbosa var. corymbosa]